LVKISIRTTLIGGGEFFIAAAIVLGSESPRSFCTAARAAALSEALSADNDLTKTGNWAASPNPNYL
jgi:hypothetical protein